MPTHSYIYTYVLLAVVCLFDLCPLVFYRSGCAHRCPRVDRAQPVGPQHYDRAGRQVGGREVTGPAAERDAQSLDVSEPLHTKYFICTSSDIPVFFGCHGRFWP